MDRRRRDGSARRIDIPGMGISGGTAALHSLSTASVHARPRSPVVLVGGVGHKLASWDPWVRDLGNTPHSIANIPRAGFVPRATYHDAIDAARTALLREADLPADTPVSLIGFSNGGLASTSYLRAHPELVDRVVTVSSPLRGNEAASVGAALLGPLTPRWIRDISRARSPLTDMPAEVGARITSVTGAPFDGIVSARSGTDELVNVVRARDIGGRGLLHDRMQTHAEPIRAAALQALAAH